jgi:hypothetical protein
MPLSTDSGYLPDWLRALLGQGGVAANAPTGCFLRRQPRLPLRSDFYLVFRSSRG